MYKIQSVWETRAGLNAVVIMTHMGHRCGYVGVGKKHILYGVGYNQDCDELIPYFEQIEREKVNIDDIGYINLLCFDGKPKPVYCIHVHGGLTYAGGNNNYPVDLVYNRPWRFGFDCGHYGDAQDSEWSENSAIYSRDGEVRSLEYCVKECERMSAQLVEIQKAYELRKSLLKKSFVVAGVSNPKW